MCEAIAKIRKNSREDIAVLLDEFNGHQIFNARVFYQAQDGTMRPGKAGIAFRVDLLPEFAQAVQGALEEARRRGLVE